MQQLAVNNIEQDALKAALEYCPKTGNFVWLRKSGAGRLQSWNKRWAGKIAGCERRDGYRLICVDGKLMYAHRLAWIYMNGAIGDLEVDHIDHNPRNNAISNLRLANHQDNLKNQKLRATNKSGAMGVEKLRVRDKWIARITECGKQVFLGTFDDHEQAAAARKLAESKLEFHQNHGLSIADSDRQAFAAFCAGE